MCRHILLLPMCLFDVSFLFCFELIFLIYSAMRGGTVVLFQYHFQCLYSSCLTFFLFVKRAGECCVSFREQFRLVFRRHKVLENKYYPTGGDFFSNLHYLLLPLRTRPTFAP